MFKGEDEWLKQQRSFWNAFYHDLKQHGPKTTPLEHPEGHEPQLKVDFDRHAEHTRPDYMQITNEQQHALTTAHSAFVQALGNRTYSLPYKPGTRGVVTTAGGNYLNVALVSVRMLRRTGSVLPVEVFLADWSEFDEDICGAALPSLNARCVVLEDIFNTYYSLYKVDISTYQFKVLSIMLSSFEEVLFLDSDCFPVHDPSPLFDKQPFTDTGLILWPDFWFPSESHLYFDIAGIPAPDVHKQSSTEAGEIMYSKSKQEAGILLAAYYNYYGPDFYYPLQSQGAPGEGDKETFLWASIATNTSYYAVREPVNALGYRSSAGDWRGSAMVQFDPFQDYHNATTPYRPRPFFLHVNFPKIDPGQIFIPEHLSFGVLTPVLDSDNSMRRIWHSTTPAALEFFMGEDVEKAMWEEVKDIACTYEKTIRAWRGKKDVCHNATVYYDHVFLH
ncbi:glycosyltransferase family 71 protein [Baudoinia panamericana UAMH 10762]|uniref:Glycosyltransferase family 71 protein n=1 Tax=Baudoinia panamericana (strain UAMH 10762) TaxID=717646 RepID=M2MA08_BAUPA|nr:glycosyltransferase family 71 protein [Baudoinia panamericana UAMH 10762]EMC93301.1 glycosyltransferase family 71 protein [Baudoinia panamericana UAMH 10762]